jgi:hypothetical protein
LLPDSLGESRIIDHRAGRGRNEVIEQQVLGAYVVAVSRYCDYVLRGPNSTALVRSATHRLLHFAGFVRSAASAAVAGYVLLNCAEELADALLEQAEQQASAGNQ